MSDASRVVCRGDGLRFGYIRHPIHAFIDTRSAGPGELTVFCSGPEESAFCELQDKQNGTFKLTVTAQDIGMHALSIKYDDKDVPGSPFPLKVSPAGMVKLRGPGLRDGLFAHFDDKFIVDSQEAGPGEITVKIGGPKGAFKLHTSREGRRLHCKYNPQRPGVYVVNIAWSGDPLPGSPFQVYICSNEAELKRHLAYGTATNSVPIDMEDEDNLDNNIMYKSLEDVHM